MPSFDVTGGGGSEGAYDSLSCSRVREVVVKSTDASHSIGVAPSPTAVGRLDVVSTIDMNLANSSLSSCDEVVYLIVSTIWVPTHKVRFSFLTSIALCQFGGVGGSAGGGGGREGSGGSEGGGREGGGSEGGGSEGGGGGPGGGLGPWQSME